ncbi:hypothetical protein VaNZ11_007834, partial [Volvox africanus]
MSTMTAILPRVPTSCFSNVKCGTPLYAARGATDENKLQVIDAPRINEPSIANPTATPPPPAPAAAALVNSSAKTKINGDDINALPKMKLFPVPPKDQSVLRDHSNRHQKERDVASAASSSSFNALLGPMALQRDLPSDYQAFIHTSRYARWVESKRRRETWPETVERYMDYMARHLRDTCSYDMPTSLRSELSEAIIKLEVMPSMRSMMTAGDALSKCHVAGYNCSYLPIDHPFAFDETLFVLMNGTGVGFSVERHQVDQLPRVAEKFVNS